MDEPSSTRCTSAVFSIIVPTCGCSTARMPFSVATRLIRLRLSSSVCQPLSSSSGRLS